MNERDMDPYLLTPREAANALSISERTLWTLTQNGEIRRVRIGRLVRYAPADLQSFLDARRGPDPQEGNDESR